MSGLAAQNVMRAQNRLAIPERGIERMLLDRQAVGLHAWQHVKDGRQRPQQKFEVAFEGIGGDAFLHYRDLLHVMSFAGAIARRGRGPLHRRRSRGPLHRGRSSSITGVVMIMAMGMRMGLVFHRMGRAALASRRELLYRATAEPRTKPSGGDQIGGDAEADHTAKIDRKRIDPWERPVSSIIGDAGMKIKVDFVWPHIESPTDFRRLAC